jgi:hypothetical protein
VSGSSIAIRAQGTCHYRSVLHVVAVFPGVDIVSLFPTDGRGRCGAVVVARPDDGVVRQLHQAADGFAQGGAIAAGQVGAATVADKKRVARKEISLRMEANAARGVAGRVNDFEGDRAQLQGFFILQKNIGLGISSGIERMDEDFRPGQ